MIKTFEIDYDDPKALRSLILKLDSRRKKLLRDLGYNQISFNTSKTTIDKVLPIFDSIINSDISSLYEDDSYQDYYVYFHCDPTLSLKIKHDIKHLFLASRYNISNIPFYVGKGRGNRYLDFNRNEGHRKVRSSILKKDNDIISIKICDKMSLSEALSLESKLIDILGLKVISENGLLTNLDEGVRSSDRRRMYPKEAKLVIIKNNFTFT